jgi:hypothetical protein
MFVNYRSECEFSDYHGGIKSRSRGMRLFAVRWTDINSLMAGTVPSSESELRRLLSSERYCLSVYRTTQHHMPGDYILVNETITSETPHITG